jgi:transposase
VVTRPAPQRGVHPARLGLAFDIAYDTLLATVTRRDRLDTAITEMAAASEFTPVVTRLGCLRGVSTLTAFGLAVEIGDWHRLTGRSIGAYLGLVPTESSSGESRSRGSITKTGNGHARRLLIEAAFLRFLGVEAVRADWDEVALHLAALNLGQPIQCFKTGRYHCLVCVARSGSYERLRQAGI